MKTFRGIIQFLSRNFKLPILIKSEFTPNSAYFTKIYNKKMFGKSESLSGPGSTLKGTKEIREALPKLIDSFGIGSIADIPCGDLNWIKELDLKNQFYCGYDIVPELVALNKLKYPELEFKILDATEELLPGFDLIICRDLLIHLTLAQSKKVLDNFKNSGSKFLLGSTYLNLSENKEIIIPKIGVGFRPLNLSLSPFNLGTPELLINEGTTEGRGRFADKSLALWKIN